MKRATELTTSLIDQEKGKDLYAKFRNARRDDFIGKKINKITVMEHHNKKTVCEKKVRINRKISRKLLTTKNKQGRNRKSLLEI